MNEQEKARKIVEGIELILDDLLDGIADAPCPSVAMDFDANYQSALEIARAYSIPTAKYSDRYITARDKLNQKFRRAT